MPNPHPFLVHFPIALLTISFVFDAIGLAAKRAEQLRTGWWTMLAGVVGLIATVTSGLLAEKTVTIIEPAREHFAMHQQIGFLVAGLYATLFLWRIASRTALPVGKEWLFVALSLLGVAGIWLGAWYGGELVYRFGIGVGR